MKKILALILATLTLLTLLVSCTKTGNDGEETTPPDGNTVTTKTVNIYTLNGTTGFGMAKLIADSKSTNTTSTANAGQENSLDVNQFYTSSNKVAPKYNITVQTDPQLVQTALLNGDIDIAALPTNAASNLYNKSAGKVQILAINTRGVLYLLQKGEATVTSMADLKGKTVYVPAQNPNFIFSALCKKNGLIPGTDITIDNQYSTPELLKDAVAQGLVEYAVLPEPVVTVTMANAKKANVTLSNALNLTAEWDKVFPTQSLVQGCVAVRKEFAEQNPEIIKTFLADYKASIEYLNTNPKEVSQMIVDAGIFANATVAEKAIPKCNIAYMDGSEMKAAMEVFLAALMEINPKAIGDKLPEADFYYSIK